MTIVHRVSSISRSGHVGNRTSFDQERVRSDTPDRPLRFASTLEVLPRWYLPMKAVVRTASFATSSTPRF
eukprot:SAG11_NODE_604_length_8248_cov_6.574251_2_plen_70_part_00